MIFMNTGRMFLLENGVISLRDADGNTASIPLLLAFKYSGVAMALGGKTYVDYEPERQLHIDDALGEGNVFADHPHVELYENVIAKTTLIKERILNPYFDKLLDDAKEIAKKSIREMFESYINENYSVIESVYFLVKQNASKLSEIETFLDGKIADMQWYFGKVTQAETVEEVQAIVEGVSIS